MSTAAARVLHQAHQDHPLLAALARAPIGKPFPPEQRVMLDEQMEAICNGQTKLVPQEERGAWMDAHVGELDDPDE